MNKKKCSGVQHLTSISKDEVLAPYVALVPTERPGDLYSYVAELVWKRLEEMEYSVPQIVYNQLDEVMEKASKLQEAYNSAPPGSEVKQEAYRELAEYRNHTRALREALFPVYWMRIKDPKLRRKIVKRPTMCVG